MWSRVPLMAFTRASESPFLNCAPAGTNSQVVPFLAPRAFTSAQSQEAGLSVLEKATELREEVSWEPRSETTLAGWPRTAVKCSQQLRKAAVL